jgi:hypothetical protein
MIRKRAIEIGRSDRYAPEGASPMARANPDELGDGFARLGINDRC